MGSPERCLQLFVTRDNQPVALRIDPRQFSHNAMRAILFHQVFNDNPKDICVKLDSGYMLISAAVLSNAREYPGDELGKLITRLSQSMKLPIVKTISLTEPTLTKNP